MASRRSLGVLLASAVLAGCASVPVEPAVRVVVPPAQAEAWRANRSLPDGLDGPYWLPSDSLIARVDRALLRHLPSVSTPRRDGLRGIDQYGIQYLGYTRDGRRVVYANGFCDWARATPDPREGWRMVFDGGGCFFGAMYDPAAGRLVHVHANTTAD